MNSQRLSLSSSVFTGRIKKYDTYQHDSRTSQRVSSREAIAARKVVNSKPIVGKQVVNRAIHAKALKSTHKTLNIRSAIPTPPNVTIFEGKSSLDNWRPSSSIQKKEVKTHKDNAQIINAQHLALSVVSGIASSQTKIIESQFRPSLTKSRFSKFKINMSKPQMIFYGFGMVVFLFAGFVSVQTLLTNIEAQRQIGVLGEQTFVVDSEGVIESEDGSVPAEAEVTSQALSSYRVDPEAPRYLRIPDIGVNARIKSTGVNKKGAVDAPKNVNDASWFNESVNPGNVNGSSLLLGHVSGWSVPGVFKKLDKLRPGSRIEIEKGSGEKLVYEVIRGEKIPVNQVDMSKILGTEVAGQHDLKLMTCSGKYNKDTKQFEDRYIIYAKILR